MSWLTKHIIAVVSSECESWTEHWGKDEEGEMDMSGRFEELL